MNRTALTALAAGFVAIATLAAPAQAGHRSHFKGYGHGFKFHTYSAHKFHGYGHRHVHYVPVCLKKKWVWSYGHKKLVCVLWK